MSRPPFPLVWDNTSRSDFVKCPRKWELTHLHHWKPRTTSIHLHAGAAWAKGLEVARTAFYCDHQPAEAAVAAGTAALAAAYGDFDAGGHAKSLDRLVEAFLFYFAAYPLDTDPAQPYIGPNGPMIEFSFILPIDDGDDPLIHPESGDPLLYSGRADMIATYCGAVTIFDDKTTTSLGATWSAQWDLRAQFTGYAWAATQFGIPAAQVLARGISILKTKFDTAQAITHRADWRIARWHAQLKRDIRRAIACWQEGYFDYAEDDACNSYSGCMFRQPCQSADPQPWLETGFERRVWDPVTRTETKLDE